MVQIDPGGAVASSFRGSDPEAVIMAARSKDEGATSATNRVVVEAIESRHIVDELRDDGGGARSATDESLLQVIDLSSNETTKARWTAPTTIVESKDIDTSESAKEVAVEDRENSAEGERGDDEGAERDAEVLQKKVEDPVAATTEPEQDGETILNEVAKIKVQTHTDSQDCNASVFSALFACIDPTYGYNVPDSAEPKAIDKHDREESEQNTKVDRLSEMVAVDPLPDSTLPSANETTAPNDENEKETADLFQRQSDEEDSQDGQLLNLEEDLASVPSVHEDVADSVAPMEPEDLTTDLNLPSSPSGAGIVEENFRAVETNLEEASHKADLRKPVEKPANETKMTKNEEPITAIPTTKLTTPIKSKKMDENLDARRRILTKELKSVVSTHGRYDLRCANVSAALGDIMDEARDHGHATKLHQDAVSIYSCKLGDDHSTTLKAKMRLGRVLENAGDIEQAINLYYQVTVMRKALRGEKDESVGDGLVCMARALRKKEDYIQAIKELKRALKIFRQSLGDSDDKVSSTVDDIASLYITIGDFAKSAAILEEVVKLKAATVGPRSNQVGNTLLQLASAYECAGEQSDAVRSLKKAYKIFSETGGYSGEEATATLNRMAMLYEATKDHNRAAVAFLGVLRSRKIRYGAQHAAVGETYFHLGRTLRLTAQHEKALKCLKEALPIFVGQGAEVDDVKMVADIMHEMAMVNHDRGNHKDAARIFKQELSVRRKIGQPSVPFISRTLLFMGIADYSMKNYNQALKHLVEALALFQERGDEGLDCAKVLYYTGLVFEKVDNPSRAMEALAEAIRLFEDNDVDSDSKIMLHAHDKVQYLRARK